MIKKFGLIAAVVFIFINSTLAEKNTIAIRFGNSTVQRYAARELQSYLSRVSNKKFILRDSTFEIWFPDSLTPSHPVAVAKAQKAIEERAKNSKKPNIDLKKSPTKQSIKETSLPAFILGTVDTYPEYAD